MQHPVIMGLELELGLLNAPALTTHRDRVCESLLAAVAATQAHARGLLAKQEHTVFLANGAAFGLDPPGWIVPEYDTPECASPFELAAAVTAGMRLLAAAASRVNATWSRDARVRRGPRGPLRFVAASDFYQRDGRSLGHHESYGIRAPAGIESQLFRAILPWLTYRQLLTEPGFLSPARNASDGFGLSPRARHIATTMGHNTTVMRAMVTTARTTHAGRGWLRLHIISAGATVSPWAIAVRHGGTALLLVMARRGWQPPPEIVPREPIETLHLVTEDPDHASRTIAGSTITAREALTTLLDEVRRAHATEPLAPWADRVLVEWERGLALVGSGNPDDEEAAVWLEHAFRRRVIGRLLAEAGATWREIHYWSRFLHDVDVFRRNRAAPLPYAASGEALRALIDPERLPAFDALLTGANASWSELPRHRRLLERLWSADIELSRIRGGIADEQSRLRAARGLEVVSEEEIARAEREPPASTRAAARAVLIRRHAGDPSLHATWNEVALDRRRYRLPSPLSSRPPRAASTERAPADPVRRARARRWREIQMYGISSPLGPLFAIPSLELPPPEEPPSAVNSPAAHPAATSSP